MDALQSNNESVTPRPHRPDLPLYKLFIGIIFLIVAAIIGLVYTIIGEILGRLFHGILKTLCWVFLKELAKPPKITIVTDT